MTVPLLIIATLSVAIAAFANIWVRANQLEIWHANKELGLIDSAASFSTADAPYYLRYARLNKDGADLLNLDRIRLYLNWVDLAKETDEYILIRLATDFDSAFDVIRGQ